MGCSYRVIPYGRARILLDSLDIAYGFASADENSTENELVITAEEALNFADAINADAIKDMLSTPR